MSHAYGLLAGEKMSSDAKKEAATYAEELLEMGNAATLDYIDGTGGNVRVSYRNARDIAIHLQNALQTIRVLEKELRESKRREKDVLSKLGELSLTS